jgi:hypothetical protein
MSEEPDLFSLMQLAMQPGLIALSGVVAMMHQMDRRGLLDASAKTEIAAAMNITVREAERVSGGAMVGLPEVRALLDRWSDGG